MSDPTLQLIASYSSTTIDPREFAAAAEAAGFDGVGMSDHLFRTSAYPHVWVCASAMAEATERVFITTSFANNLFRSPVEFAQASLTMQWLSGGRFEAGLGAGWLEGEIRAMGLEYPEARVRARRYHEAIQIVRALFDERRCAFTGEHYTVDVPTIGPPVADAPPLVGSLGGPWTIRHVAPIVDRVELKIGASTRGGDLDTSALARTGVDDLRRMIAAVREVAPDTPIGVFSLIAVGDEAETAPLREAFGDGVYSGFVGEPASVLDHVRGLADLGIDRVMLSEGLKGSIARLGDVRA